jgi:hypothetical protein
MSMIPTFQLRALIPPVTSSALAPRLVIDTVPLWVRPSYHST